ncbi:hypothetical protein GSI_12209 [Ganoderma sinense ZZ0214-1]|uniref:Uncharacterized protein n=1 Tax=Ganoderma sinense ZZ0214-1 TaxID=1077348 RepID=A0A2G8RY55_9APHY|nr:hypothetical protein GSI_12209 [Ganoderma sinense ZZ0214-1]
MPSYAVIGASRGIGLEYFRQLAARQDSTVFAVVRNPAGSAHLNVAIAGLQNVHVVEADVADYPTLEHAAREISYVTGGKLDVLIHVAANVIMKGFDDYDNMDELDAEFMVTYKTNALGPVHPITVFLPLLRIRASSTRKIVVLSAGAAESKFNLIFEHARMAAYGMSKAAALIATTKFAVKLKDEGFVAVSLNPGFVDVSGTRSASANDKDREAIAVFGDRSAAEFGATFALTSPEASVSAQLKIIDGLKPPDNGLHLTRDGAEWAPPS